MAIYLDAVNLTRLFLLGLLFACGLSACSPDAATVAETEYSSKILGDWQGNAGGENETISFGADGGFVSLVRPGWFINMTLGQGVAGKIRGTWAISGNSITLNISSSEHERVLNSAATARIEMLKPNALVVKSSTGITSTFIRQH